MLTPDNIRQLLATGEHLHLECKRCKDRLPNSLWETYSAFANSYGGTILLGIEEHRQEQDLQKRFTIEGVTNPDKLLTDLWNLLNDPNIHLSDSSTRSLMLLYVLWLAISIS